MKFQVYEYQTADGAPLVGAQAALAWRDVSTGKPCTLDQASNRLPAGWAWTGNWRLCSEGGGTSDLQGWTTVWEDLAAGTSQAKESSNVSKFHRRMWERECVASESTAPQNGNMQQSEGVDSSNNSVSNKAAGLLQQLELLKRSIGAKLQQTNVHKCTVERLTALMKSKGGSAATRGNLATSIAAGKSILAQTKGDIATLDGVVRDLAKLGGSMTKSEISIPATSILNSVRNKLNKDCAKVESELARVCKAAAMAERDTSMQVPSPGSSGWGSRTATQSAEKSGSGAIEGGLASSTDFGTSSGWSFPSPVKDESSSDTLSHNSTTTGSTQMLQAQTEEVNAEIMQEREKALGEIAQNMQRVQEVMGDLAALTKEQEEGVNKIAQVAEKAHEQTERGLDQLRKADAAQKTGGNCVVS